MRFASKTVSLIISGLFCMIWLLILSMPMLVLPLPQESGMIEFLKLKPSGTIITMGFSFVILPFAYVMGGVMNLTASYFFRRENKKYQTEYFPKEDYNLKRFSLYGLSEEIYNHLNYHRDIIRVLRSSCINFLLIVTSLIFASCADPLKNYLWLRFVPPFFIFLYTVKGVGWFIIENKRYDQGIKISLFGLPVILMIFFRMKGILLYGHEAFSYLLFVLIGASYACAWGWHKQTCHFYKAILKCYSVLISRC